jgi:voltage-gated potassium channel Kch
MTHNKNIIIVGTGHLAHRLKIKLTDANYKITHTTHDDIVNASQSVSLIKNVNLFIERLDNKQIEMIYLLDEKDEVNLKLIIAFVSLLPSTAITASLFNENIIPHLHSRDKNICILNPAKIAAPYFVAALYKPLQRMGITNVVQKKIVDIGKKKLSLIQKLAITFLWLIITAVVFFHYKENLSWIDSLYFVVVTIATVGYGDINLANASSASKLFDVLLILASTVFIWMIFSLTVDKILKNQLSLTLGRKKYRYKNHVVLCGLGRLGYFIAEELLIKKEKVIIVEQDENGRYLNYFRQLGADVYIGDGRLIKVLDDVNVADAKALISVINNDSLNIEIGLIARSFNADLRVILRVFDEQIAEQIKSLLNIHIALSASDIADETFYEQLV